MVLIGDLKNTVYRNVTDKCERDCHKLWGRGSMNSSRRTNGKLMISQVSHDTPLVDGNAL